MKGTLRHPPTSHSVIAMLSFFSKALRSSAVYLLLLLLLQNVVVQVAAQSKDFKDGGGMKNPTLSILPHLLAGAVARGVSIFAMYPLDTMKTRFQIASGTTGKAFYSSGMYKGLSGSLLGQIPYGMLTFGCYEACKRALITQFPECNKLFIYVVSAILGDLTGSVWLVPSEVIKLRMQAGQYHSSFQALAAIVGSGRPGGARLANGAGAGFRGLYVGYRSHVMRDAPFRAIQMMSYEGIKNWWCLRTRGGRGSSGDGKGTASTRAREGGIEKAGNLKRSPFITTSSTTTTTTTHQSSNNHDSNIRNGPDSNDDLHTSSSSLSSSDNLIATIDRLLKEKPLTGLETTTLGAVAGTISAFATTPLDVVKTRIMTGGLSGHPLAALAAVAKEEGLSGLFAGVVPRIVYIAPSCALFFFVYEGTKSVVQSGAIHRCTSRTVIAAKSKLGRLTTV